MQVKVSADFAAGAKSVVRGRRPYQDAGLLVWLDDKNNLKLSRARIVDNGRTFNFFNLEFRHEGQYGELPFPKEARSFLQARTVYLRLQIHTEKTIASVSTNGVEWVTVPLPGDNTPRKLHVGIIAENNTSSPLNASFEE